MPILGRTFILAMMTLSLLSCSEKQVLDIPIYRKAVYLIKDKILPIKSVTTSEQVISNLVFDGLFNLTKFEITPSLVKSWSISPNGKIYNLQIKEGVQFHNGDALKTEDVISSILRLRDAQSGVKESFSIIKSISKVANSSIQIELIKPYPPFLSLLASPVAKVYKIENQRPVGTGMFQFAKLSNRKSIRVMELKRNENYHSERPYIKEMELWEVEEAVALKLARKGIIHDTSIYNSILIGDDENPRSLIESSPVASTWLFAYNTSKAPSSNEKFRECFRKNFKKKAFIDKFLPTHRVAVGYLPPNLLGGGEKLIQKIPVDCDKIRKMPFVIDMPSELANANNICQWIESNHPQFKVKCNTVRFSKLIERITNKKSDISFLSMNLESLDVEYFFSTFENRKGFNLSSYSSRFIDRSLEDVRGESDRSKRSMIFKDLNQYVYNKALTLNVSHPYHYSLKHKCLRGYGVDVVGETHIDYSQVSLKGNCEFTQDFEKK